MSGLALAVGVYAWLLPDARPSLVKSAVEPEARLVFEEDYAAARRGFFFIRGSFVRSQYAWASASARARRLRGR